MTAGDYRRVVAAYLRPFDRGRPQTLGMAAPYPRRRAWRATPHTRRYVACSEGGDRDASLFAFGDKVVERPQYTLFAAFGRLP